ncbi:MAG: four helix bundle protein [Dehalococcoidales bacterium]|nr:four helix bundle protein [Dehalococcoidales bacterium]
MAEIINSKRYDLEDRTLKYARDAISLINGTPDTLANSEIIKQLVRSSSSVGANYIEANGALGKKDFAMRIRICRKEAKESKFWLNLITLDNQDMENQRQSMIKEAEELMRIFNAILEKTQT